jgi:hypothetical protein
VTGDEPAAHPPQPLIAAAVQGRIVAPRCRVHGKGRAGVAFQLSRAGVGLAAVLNKALGQQVAES